MNASFVKTAAKSIKDAVIAHRRHLHAHPELSFQEFETARYVATKLRNMGIEVHEGIAGTGVVGLITGQQPSTEVVALRADMDALPITEANTTDYISKNVGVMHACGHDVHTACLLGAAQILQSNTQHFGGTIKLIFQPGEEKSPGGASLMIKEGVLTNPKPKSILGLHVMPQLEVGLFGFREGIYMASADEVYLTVKGKGGHAAIPEQLVDPVVISAHILVALQQIVSRNANPKIPSVLSFGNVQANGATNVIPNEVTIAGTFRTMNEAWRTEAKEKIRTMAQSIAQAMGGSCEVRFADGYPYLENNPEVTKRVRAYAQSYIGADKVTPLDLWMAAEDFAFYTHHVPACFYRLGVRNATKGITSAVHTPTFDIDEDALELGSGMMAWLALNELGFKD